MISRDDVLSQVKRLPPLSSAVSRLSLLLGDESASARDFEAAIRPDPSLTANILRIANSAHYGLAHEVGSVHQAVSLLGTKKVFEIALTYAFSRTLPPRLPAYGIQAAEFWAHSVAVAVLSENIAKDILPKVPDMIFTTGLLHDIGRLVLGAYFMDSPDELRVVLEEDGADVVQAEHVLFGMDHTEIGEVVGRDWRLPEAIILGVRWHHTPNEAPATQPIPTVDIVHVADCLAHSLGFGSDSGELFRRIHEDVQDRLGLPVSRYEHIACESMDSIRTMADYFTQQAGV